MSHKSSIASCIDTLKIDNPSNILELCRLLLRISGNILQHPKDEKYRQLRISNKIVMEKLLPASGGIQCIFEMGFVEVIIANGLLY